MTLTADDLAQYAPVLRAPLWLDVGGVTAGVPHPSFFPSFRFERF